MLTLGFLLVWMVWNKRLPPLMTFATMAAVGFLVEPWITLGLERWTTAVVEPVPLMVLALLSVSYAAASIIMSKIGIRVMDLLAITLMRRLGWHFLWAKLSFETSFVLLALLFGGPVGFGTLAFVLIVGTLIPPMMCASSRCLGLADHGMGEPTFPVQRPAGGTRRR